MRASIEESVWACLENQIKMFRTDCIALIIEEYLPADDEVKN